MGKRRRRMVELHRAFRWYCHECDAENYCDAESHLADVVLSVDEREELSEAMDGSLGDGAVVRCAPDVVCCGECGATFEADDLG